MFVNGPNISDTRKDSDNITRTDKIGGFLSVSRPDIINLRINSTWNANSKFCFDQRAYFVFPMNLDTSLIF